MEQEINAMGMLDLMVQPGFCVKDKVIIKANAAAQGRMITPGSCIDAYLSTGKEEYEEFTDGCLYLTLNICGEDWGASVTRMGDLHVFILEQESDQSELRAMALAAQELRKSLTAVKSTADRLFPLTAKEEDPLLQEQVARLNRGLFQMHRIIGNMSDAARYSTASVSPQETVDICALLAEIFSGAQTTVAHAGITLRFQNLNETIYCLVDREKLERAVLNIISNALKFTPRGGHIEASLSRQGRKLYLRVQDSGEGIPDSLRGSVHNRYLRMPTLEDSRFGIGLGMVLIRRAAAHHGGTVLIDHPEDKGTRITMTLAIRQNKPGTIHTPSLRIDYAGELDHLLIELSDTLPHDLYQPN